MMNDEEEQNPEARSQEPEEKEICESGSPPYILDSGF